MKHSIRRQMIAIFVGLIVCMLVILLVLVGAGLEPYYVREKEENFKIALIKLLGILLLAFLCFMITAVVMLSLSLFIQHGFSDKSFTLLEKFFTRLKENPLFFDKAEQQGYGGRTDILPGKIFAVSAQTKADDLIFIKNTKK